ncbi:MAG: bifunctional alpha/beta hydrolase/OsmC family protein [Hyphomicrobiales bacterium]
MSKLTFTNRNGHSLAANLHVSQRNSNVYAIFAHCFTCGQNIKGAKAIADQLAKEGINVLRFDFTGIGASEGSIQDAYFTSNIQDLQDAAKFLTEQYKAPSLMIGHSLGGTAVLAAAAEIPSVKAVATIGAPADSGHILKTLGTSQKEITEKGQQNIQFYGNQVGVNQQFVDDVCADHLSDRLNKLDAALLIMHSPVDTLVSVDNASTLFQLANHPKSFISLDNADHLLSKKTDAQYAARLIFDWSSAYLDLPSQISHPKAKADEVVANLKMEDTYLTTISMGEHCILADEPVKLGGSDLGANPGDLLKAALASCTTITLSMYATRKKWVVKNINCVVKSNIVEGKKTFDRGIAIEGDLSDDQRQRMLQIANKCPVHKTLTHGAEVNSHLI